MAWTKHTKPSEPSYTNRYGVSTSRDLERSNQKLLHSDTEDDYILWSDGDEDILMYTGRGGAYWDKRVVPS